MKIHPLGAKLFLVDGQTDRHEKANSWFSKFVNMPKNITEKFFLL